MTATVIATAGSPAKLAVAKERGGADHAINYRDDDWIQQVKELTDGDGVDDADESDGSGLATATDCTLVTDCDGDGVDDSAEADGSALDLDGDGTADGIDCAVDTDCDDDGTADDADAFPVDASETTDTDGDGTGNTPDTYHDGTDTRTLTRRPTAAMARPRPLTRPPATR